MPPKHSSLASREAVGQESKELMSWQIAVDHHWCAHNCPLQLHGLTVELRGCSTGHREHLMQ